MANDGTQFGIRLPVEGTTAVERAAAALDSVANKALAAGAAVDNADAAVRAAEASYKRAEAAADKAAKAVEKVGILAEAQKGKLAAALEAGDVGAAERIRGKIAELAARQAELATKSAAAKAALAAEAASLDKLGGALVRAQTEEVKLVGAQEKAQKAFDEAKGAAEKAAGSGKFNEAAEALGKLGGPLGVIGQKAFGAVGGLSKLTASLGSAGPYVAIGVALVAIVAGMAAIGAVAAIATVKVAAWAVGLADAARTQRLLADGVARSVEGGAVLDAQINRLTGLVPLAREELLQMAGGLAEAGFRGDALSKQLEIAAVRAAKLKFGPDFQKQLLSLSSQTTRLKANISGVFGGLKIDALLEAMSKLVALFDETSSTGKAMKVLFESLFQPLIDGAAALTPKIIAAFIQIEIWVLKVAIAVKPFASKILLMAEAFAVVAGVLVLLAGILVGLILAPFILLGAVLTIAAANAIYFWQQISTAVDGAGALASSIEDRVIGAFNHLRDMDLASIGSDIVTGLVAGVEAAGPALIDAITGLADNAIAAAKKKLKIASPSKVMADEIGYQMGAGVAVGVDASAGDVRTALEQLALPDDLAQPIGAPAAASSSSGPLVHVEHLEVNGKDATEQAFNLVEALERILAQRGLGRPEPSTP